jgi:transposase
MRIGWRTVGRIIDRVVAREEARGPDPLDGLRFIGVDELSYRKHHKYITIVTDQVSGRVIWAAEGKNAETLDGFFAQLGPERCAALEGVTLDLSAAFIKAVREGAPQAKLIFDRFHVQKLVHEALDEVRRELARTADKEEKKALKGTRYALHKRDWNLTPLDRGKLADVEAFNKPLYRGYILKEMLVAALDRRQPNVARAKIIQWLDSARDSGLAPFRKAARTIGKHIDGITEYIRTGLSNGRSEGLNGKARTLTRRAYGFHSSASLISLLFLCCGGIHLNPSHVYPSNLTH